MVRTQIQLTDAQHRMVKKSRHEAGSRCRSLFVAALTGKFMRKITIRMNRSELRSRFPYAENIKTLGNEITSLRITIDFWIVPVLSVKWVDKPLHRRGVARLQRELRRKLSLKDCISFEFMKSQGLTDALALDHHFAEAGFNLIPKV